MIYMIYDWFANKKLDYFQEPHKYENKIIINQKIFFFKKTYMKKLKNTIKKQNKINQIK